MKHLNENEQLALDELLYLHAMNRLTKKKVSAIGLAFNVESEQLCKEQGITYTIEEDGDN